MAVNLGLVVGSQNQNELMVIHRDRESVVSSQSLIQG